MTAKTTAMTTTRIKLLLAYDGTDFAGWQHQGGVRTVQSDVEAALAKIVGEPKAAPVMPGPRPPTGQDTASRRSLRRPRAPARALVRVPMRRVCLEAERKSRASFRPDSVGPTRTRLPST